MLQEKQEDKAQVQSPSRSRRTDDAKNKKTKLKHEALQVMNN
jgi:hypothetical protein